MIQIMVIMLDNTRSIANLGTCLNATDFLSLAIMFNYFCMNILYYVCLNIVSIEYILTST